MKPPLLLLVKVSICVTTPATLSEAVSGFASHEVRHDHLWVKQGRAVRRASRGEAAESNVKTLFAGKAATD